MTNHQGPIPCFQLYGTERSYFSAKTRVNLRAKRLYFEESPTSGEVYADIRKRTGLIFIPVVITPEDETWQDTSDIFDALETRFPEPALLPPTPVQRIVAYLFELYADEFMVLPAMHYRWTEPAWEQDARGAFAAVTGDRSTADRFADRMSGMLPPLGVSPASIPGITAHFHELLAALDALFAEQSFLLGDQLSLADCALMGPMYAHLYLDLGPGQLLRESAPHVGRWIERCNHPAPQRFTGFVADDALHPRMRAVLELIGGDAVPLLLAGLQAFERWADERPADLVEPPRALGMHDCTLRGRGFERYTSSYLPWLAQRTLDAYGALDSLESGGRDRVDAALSGTGCEALFAHRPRHRLGKRDFKLVFETSA